MRSKYIKEAIDKLGPWYQRYEMEGQWTTDKKISGEDVWSDIRSLLNEDLHGSRILDIGSNAAYYSMMFGMEGAIVTAIEPDKKFFNQGKWTQYFFEEKHHQKFPVTLLNKSAEELNFKKMGEFDYILALSVIHYIKIEEQKRIVEKICKASNKIIVTTENDKIINSIGYYNALFLEKEFYMIKKILGKMPVMRYGKLVKEDQYILKELEQTNERLSDPCLP